MQPTFQKDHYSIFARFGLLFGLFFIMLIAMSALIQLISRIPLDPRSSALLVAALQCILVFIIPAIIYARIFSRKPLQTLELTTPINIRQIIGIIIVFIIGTPFLNWIVSLNEGFIFPSSMSELETTLKEMEKTAMTTTEVLLDTSSIAGLISGVLIIGVLTGFAEELFFRAGIQQGLIVTGINPHIAIWSAAFIFSFMHFQFFGFIPRMLLGAFFGYLLYWSKSIWLSTLAHTINNSIVIVSTWLQKREIFSLEVEKLGLSNGYPWMTFISLTLLILFFYLYRKNIFYSKTKLLNSPL